MQGLTDASGEPHLGFADECLEEKGGGKIGSSASGIEVDVVIILQESSLDSLRALQGQKIKY